MPEFNQAPYFEDTYTVDSVHPDYRWSFTTYGIAFPAPPLQDESLDVCHSTPQSIIPPFTHDIQTLEAPQHYPPRSMELWVTSHSGNDEYPSLFGSSWRHPTTMDAPQTASLTSGYKRSTLSQPSASAFGVAYRSEAQKGTPLDFVDSFHSELERLQQSNTSQKGSESKPVPGSAEWANRFALQNATKITVPMTKELPYAPCEFPPSEVAQHSSFTTDGWQYSERGESKPDLRPEARVTDLPFQNAPVEYLACASALPSESTTPRTALTGLTTAAYGGIMAQAPPSAMMPYSTFTYGPQTANSWLDESFPICHLDGSETVYSSDTAAQWPTPTDGSAQTVMTTPDPKRLVPIAATPRNVVNPAHKQQNKKRRGRPTTKCDQCHRRRRNCEGSKGTGSCDLCTRLRDKRGTDACTWDICRRYNE